MHDMFSRCHSLKTLNLSKFDFSKVKDFNGFYECRSLKSIKGLKNLDTSSLTDMEVFFYKCRSLKTLDLSGFNTSKVRYMCNMFNGCKSLKTLDLSSFDTSKVKDFKGIFNGCTNLKSVKLGKKFSFKGNGHANCSLPGSSGSKWKHGKFSYSPKELAQAYKGSTMRGVWKRR